MRSTTEYTTIEPHGGELVNRRVPEGERAERLRKAEELSRVALGPRALSDLEMISTGVFSPLTGFMDREDYESVVETMRLANGLAWSMPITLSAGEEEANGFAEGDEVALVAGGEAAGGASAGEDRIVATMTVTDRYSYDKG